MTGVVFIFSVNINNETVFFIDVGKYFILLNKRSCFKIYFISSIKKTDIFFALIKRVPHTLTVRRPQFSTVCSFVCVRKRRCFNISTDEGFCWCKDIKCCLVWGKQVMRVRKEIVPADGLYIVVEHWNFLHDEHATRSRVSAACRCNVNGVVKTMSPCGATNSHANTSNRSAWDPD